MKSPYINVRAFLINLSAALFTKRSSFCHKKNQANSGARIEHRLPTARDHNLRRQMSLPISRQHRHETSESSVIVSIGNGDGDESTETISAEDSSNSRIESVDGTSTSDDESSPIPTITSKQPASEPAGSCLNSWLSISALRGTAEFLWQSSGRLVNASSFIAFSAIPSEPLRIITTALSGVTAGYCGYRILRSKIGTESCGQVLVVAAGTAVAAGTGAVATYYASAVPGLALASSGLISFVWSGINANRSHTVQQTTQRTAFDKLNSAGPPALLIAGSATGIAVAVCVPSLRVLDTAKLGARNLSLLSEAITTELCKGVTERVMPSADRSVLSFERKLKIGLLGVLPYAIASVVFSGVLGNLLRAQMKSDSFTDYLMPLLVGALANVVKGAVNAALTRCGGEIGKCGVEGTEGLRAREGIRCPPAGITFEKAVLRYVISNARDVLYLALVSGGLDEIRAACLAYSLYAFFAQHRDLMFDMMQGEGWTEPSVTTRVTPSSV